MKIPTPRDSVLLAFFGFLIGTTAAQATVELPSVFSDHAVVQREKALPVWGTASPGEKVTVSFLFQKSESTADAEGHWQVTLAPLAASDQPADLVVAATNTVTVHDLLVGDVWLCSGQSNMEKPIGEQRGQKPVFHSDEELKTGDRPLIRLLKIPKTRLAAPSNNVEAHWVVCTPESLDKIKFSATGFFFGRKIQDEIKVPLGLIDSTWGGTRIEPWTPPAGYTRVPALADIGNAPKKDQKSLNNTTPSVLYNGMIHPLAPFSLRGILWYQGESNLMDLNDSARYPDKMEALVLGWREVWHDADLPFYYVQIAPHFYHVIRRQVIISPESLAEFWEAQAAALRIPNTGMVVTTDLVDDLMDIHPRNKQDVGLRLTYLALNRTYGKKDVIDAGPVFQKWEVQDGRAKLFFNYTAGGLESRDKKPLSWFTIAGEDGRFYPAQAVIDGEQVIVSSPHVAKPVKVRFAWDEAAQPNLMNRAGLPAQPFRTDNPFRSDSASK